jgi:hypothetical protein
MSVDDLPRPIQNIRKAKKPYSNPSQYYLDDIGDLAAVRDELYKKAEATPVVTESLEDALYSKRGKKEKKLPEKVGMNELLDLVQTMKRDIKFIKDTQSKAGAENWIARNGYGDKLYVEDKDIDGDGVPDIIVKKRDDRSPYIVKGYTTEQSAYPLRSLYYTRYPTREDRREGLSYNDFVEDIGVASYRHDGQARQYIPDFIAKAAKMKEAGYKVKIPSQRISPTNAFKMFIVKPLMHLIKTVVRDHNLQFNLDMNTARSMEALLRHNLITAPVLKRIYGDRALTITDDTLMKRAMARATVKNGIKDLTAYLIDHRIVAQDRLLDGILNALIFYKVIDPKDKGGIFNEVRIRMEQSEEWQQQYLDRV